MPLGLPFDYLVVGPGEARRRIRLTRGRNPTYFSEHDYEAIAISVWTLNRLPCARAEDIKFDQIAYAVCSFSEVSDDSLADIDSYVVCAAVGRTRLLAIAKSIGQGKLCDWFEQEADLIDEDESA